MKIVVAGGKNKADFLISSLLEKHHQLVVINDDAAYCAYLSRVHKIPVICGDPCKLYVMDEADIEGYDIIIALKPGDADNLAICQTAKRIYHVSKTVALVSNPKNVELFRKLGVSNAISATYMIANYIEQASTVENLVSTLSVEHGQIVLTELLVESASPVCGKQLMDIDFRGNVIISCIVRGADMLIPNGRTQIHANDKLIILSSPEHQADIIKKITAKES